SREAIRFYNGFRVFRYSYAEIYDFTRRCILLLQAKGVRKGDRVMIWAPGGPEWAGALYACAASGVVLVPLDIRNTAEVARRLQDETEANLIVQTRFKPDADLACPVLYAEELFEQLNRVDPVELFEDIQPHDTLEIVYTSGTTGKPKGVVLSHQNIASN